jgi:predicted ATPase
MKITQLTINNFKAIRKLTLNDLTDVIVIAGPNGSGKSCILDAIRFLKSSYAGYREQEEWRHFFNEFQLDINNREELRRLYYNPEQPITISAEFSLSETEAQYIRANAHTIIRDEYLEQRLGERRIINPGALQANAVASWEQEANKLSSEFGDKLLAALDNPRHTATVTFDTNTMISVSPNVIFDFLFGIYDPTNIRMIDYHSAHRTYQREKIGGINVSIEESINRIAQHALFNWQNKYTHIKSELAGAYIRDLLIEKAGSTSNHTPSIIDTMNDLFSQFLPRKTFTGPRPSTKGQLSFPVQLAGGGEHDIDDLSSGEKELVYGYLRIRNVAPRNSIIMLDEPELHLNPRLVLGLPAFYRKHLGLELGNQLWMTTHSDAFLRDAYKSGGFTIFHMSAPDTVGTDDDQGVAISADSDINRAIVDLVGDIAGFRPGNKVVVFESSESASFDASLTKRLFPEFSDRINALSGDNKFGVRQLYSALEKAVSQMALPFRVYAITDRDSGREQRPASTRAFDWDVYHIENYLLDESFIEKVVSDYPSFGAEMSKDDIQVELENCAELSLAPLLQHEMRSKIYGRFLECLDLGFDPKIAAPSQGFSAAVIRVRERIQSRASDEFSPEKLDAMQHHLEQKLRAAVADGSWRSVFRGRDILRHFVNRRLHGLPYEAFRDAIVARMADANHRPAGMARVVEAIMND